MTDLPDFDAFVKKISGDVITPDHHSYPAAIARWARNAERPAKVVVFVKSTDDVAHSIAYAKANKLLFAIRGGGHNASGASSAKDGLVVDMSRYYKTVRVDAEQKLAYVGAGCVWHDVDVEAIKYGLATVGGTISHTGVAGLTLGGGYGWLSGRHGLTVDNLQQATLVLADGSVVVASETSNPDLFWAIRGGGSNFGVVTEFVLRLHPQRKTIFGGMALYTMDQIEKLIEVTRRWWPNIKPDEGILMATAADAAGTATMPTFFFYNGSEEEGRANFKEFFDIGPVVNTTRDMPYEELNTQMDVILCHGKCYYFKGVAQSEPDYPSTLQILNRGAELAKSGEFTPGILYEYFPRSKINSVPFDSTPFRRMASGNILVMVLWEDSPEKTARAREVVNDMIDNMIMPRQTLVPEEDKAGYTNYDLEIAPLPGSVGRDAQYEKARQSFGANLPRLQEIKKKYDPEVFFNRWCPVPPA
ncbi:FAD binding domain-containing protein [Coprinopsis cinerea okayama7|uniref:FAD binding domain-containing protein n=1 Tax=Coprinopsis cinerea (strain Okayama-7 / 130 / ATCC MYA-4618 / FGSC 9003) TaxID=240176 RepID=A8NZ67_COPC7|nr:FAD binding domain-containing protein [Coprinopsis cinerea okayama7\|eukprot:XP_001837617.1 FAD binding domain-containing protein [Coprinopsis cinerea okayama7\